MSGQRFVALLIATLVLIAAIGTIFYVSGFNQSHSDSTKTFLYEQATPGPNTSQDRSN